MRACSSRLYPPTEGKILFDGEDVSEHRRKQEVLDYRSKVQMIFQDPFSSLNPVKRIDHHIARPLQIHGIRPRGEVEARVHELLQQVGLIPPDGDRGRSTRISCRADSASASRSHARSRSSRA